jgi:hypothetical protein
MRDKPEETGSESGSLKIRNTLRVGPYTVVRPDGTVTFRHPAHILTGSAF